MQVNHKTISNWMAQRGTTCYQIQIKELETLIEETKGDAGRYWQECDFTQARIASIKIEITEIKQAAMDRYQDWASD